MAEVKPHNAVKKQSQLSLAPLDLVASAAHEIKTPLAVITGLTAMLAEGQFGKLNTAQLRYIERVHRVGERLLVLVESLLNVNKSYHGSLDLALEPLAARPLLQAVVDELTPRVDQNLLNVKLLSRRSLEPVLADRECLYQVFYNLLDNAIKYSPPKTIITIKFRHQGGGLYVRFSDQGFGVKPNELKYLFRRFGSLRQPVGAQGGSTGLGLFIVKKLVEAQGGRIWAKSLPRGTCFIVKLPLVGQLALFNVNTLPS